MKRFYVNTLVILFVLVASTSTMVYNNTNSVQQVNSKSNPNQTRTDQWIINLQANSNNPEWFYLNLNSSDRLNVRLALDYAIPRQDIIDSIIGGFGLPLATSDTPLAGPNYYDAAIQARPYDLTQAKSLLTQVFGYTYQYGYNDPTTPYDESQSYFSMGLIVPSTNPLRAQWAERVQFAYKTIGIDVSILLLTFPQINTRIFNNVAGIGHDYAHGGSDGLFIGWSGSQIPDAGFFFYDPSAFPDVGGNYQFVNNSILTGLIAQEKNVSLTQAQQGAYYYKVQQFLHDQVVKNVLFQEKSLYVMNPNLQNVNPFYLSQGIFPAQSMYFTGAHSNTSLVAAIPDTIANWNPLLSNYFIDNFYLSNLYLGGLMTLTNPTTDPTYLVADNSLNLANWYNVSADGLTYFFNLRPGLKWHDGTPITSADVAFTYKSVMAPIASAADYSTIVYQMDNNSVITFPSNNTLIEFKLTRNDPLTMFNLWDLTIVQKATFSQIPYSKWLTDNTNTGANIAAINNVANGPYNLTSYSHNIGILQPWSGWNSAYSAKFANLPYNAVPAIQNLTIVVRNDATTALAGLQSGELDYGDTNIGFSTVFANIKSNAIVKYVNATGTLYQELGLNQASPIWGLSPLDPSGPQLNYSNTTITTITTNATTTITTTIVTSPTTPTTSESSTTSISGSNSESSSVPNISSTPGFEFSAVIIFFTTLAVLTVRRRKR